MVYDVIIIGGGPAGLTAGIYTVRKAMKTLILAESLGGQTSFSGEIGNYLGFSMIEGPDLTTKFKEHLKTYEDIELKEGAVVSKLHKKKDTFEIKTQDNKIYSTRTVILAMGQDWRKLNVPGEAEFTGRGVSYCATCDGPLFAGKEVVVVGGGNSGLEAALELSKIAKNVHIIQNLDSLTGDDILVHNVKHRKNIKISLGSAVKDIFGEKFVRGVTLQKGGKDKKLSAQGVFIEIGMIPRTGIVKDLVQLNDWNEIVIDNMNCTNVPGVFAAGDITEVRHKQIIIAAGEGAKAGISAFRYLINRREGNEK